MAGFLAPENRPNDDIHIKTKINPNITLIGFI